MNIPPLLMLALLLVSLSAVPGAVVKDDGLDDEMSQLETFLLELDGSQNRVKRAAGDRGVT